MATATRKRPAKKKAAKKASGRKEVARAKVPKASKKEDPRDPLAVNCDELPKKERKPKAAPPADANGAATVGSVAALDIPVSFGGVSIGKKTARLGVKVRRANLNVIAANDVFCDRRLSGHVLLGNDDGMLFEKSLEVDGVFDVKGFGCRSDEITAGLTFQLKEIDIATLAKFSNGAGKLVVDEVSGIPDDDEDELLDE